MTPWLEFGLSNALAATALAALALVVTRFTRRPQWAFAAWMLVLAKLLVPPLVGMPLPSLRSAPPAPDVPVAVAGSPALRPALPTVDGAAVETTDRTARPQLAPPKTDAAAVEPQPRTLRRAVSPAGLLAAIWLFVSGCWLAVAVARMARFVRVLSRAQPAPPALEQEVRSLAVRLGVRRVPRVKVIKRRIPPLVWALFGRPVILLPAGLLRILSAQQRSTLLAHELVHLKRRDHLARLVELAALCLYWWHPVAWWARRGAQRAAEQCCDAEVVAHLPDATRAYAEALLKTVDFLSEARWPLPVGANGFSEASHVKRRLEMILNADPVRRPVRSIRLLLLAAGLAALPLSLRALWAEPTVESAEKSVAVDGAQPSETQAESASDSAASVPNANSIERRLDRLEKMIESLAARVQSDLPAASPPKPRPSSLFDPRLFSGDLDDDLAKILKQAKRNLQLVETNHHRKQAAIRQIEALKEAYKADTVTLDQLLEAQRRLPEAEVSYVRTVCELCPDAQRRRYLQAAANLIIGNKSLNEARQTWQQIKVRYADGSAENKAEAQAREQYYQFKSQTQKLLDEFLEVARIRLLD